MRATLLSQAMKVFMADTIYSAKKAKEAISKILIPTKEEKDKKELEKSIKEAKINQK